MNDPIYENDHYRVELTDNALGERNEYGSPGYAVVNKETLVTEHTTIMLPQALFQADAFSGALGQLQDVAEDGQAAASIIEDDTKPH